MMGGVVSDGVGVGRQQNLLHLNKKQDTSLQEINSESLSLQLSNSTVNNDKGKGAMEGQGWTKQREPRFKVQREDYLTRIGKTEDKTDVDVGEHFF